MGAPRHRRRRRGGSRAATAWAERRDDGAATTAVPGDWERAPTHAVHWEARLHLEQKCGASDDGSAAREVLQEQLDAYKAHLPWKTNNDALEQVAEVAAQLVESQLESGEVPLLRAAKAMVDAMLYAASEKLAASPGCEQLRMLMSRIQRHDDD